MTIHTVKNGDTIFKVARRYLVQPTKIIEDNGLNCDRLIVGQELLILTPTRTVNVRGGDTLASVARRFGVRRQMLLANNPALKGKESLRPGHILSVKFDTPPMGAASAVGFYTSRCNQGKLMQTLPYITYLVVAGYSIGSDELTKLCDGKSACQFAKTQGKIPILAFYDKTNGDFLLSSKERENLLTKIIGLAKSEGYKGIFLSCREGGRKYKSELCSFLMQSRKQLIGCDLILLSDIFPESPYEASELSDGAILHTGWHPNAQKEIMKTFANESESSKIFIEIPTVAKDSELSRNISDAMTLALRNGCSIRFCEDDESLFFNYKHYVRGKGEDRHVSFPSLKKIRNIFTSSAELGYMGIAFDIETVPISYLSMFNCMFCRADYSIPFAN